MPFKSTWADIDIPKCDVLTYLFGSGSIVDDPLWINSRQPSKHLSAKRALQWAKRLSFGLQRLGLDKGDVVLLCTPNHIFVPVAYLGIIGSGCIFSGANPAYKVSELAYQLSNTAAKAILAHPNVLSSVLVAADASGVPKGRIFQFSDEAALERDGVKDWTSMVGSSEEGKTWNWPVLGLGEAATQVIATINYSSGTTGLPKGVCISHANLIANCEQSQFMRYVNTQYSSSNKPPQERWLGFLPLYHAYGQLYTILMAIKMQNPIYVMSEFTFEQFLNAIQQYKITSLQVVPPILKMLTQRAETEQYNLASITGIICGAAPLPHDLQNECRRKFGVNVRQGWGMTELTCTGIATPFSDNIYVGSVGSLIPNCECKLVDDDGREVDAGSHGELCIKGPNVCSGYWMNKEATQKTILEGWLKTGDIAVRNKEGLFWIVDRKKELIKVNGLQVAPAELEAVLLENEHVMDAAVVGVTRDGNELPRAYVVININPGRQLAPEDIQEWVALQVAKHKRLEGGVAFISEVPKLATGKIHRKILKEWAKRDAQL